MSEKEIYGRRRGLAKFAQEGEQLLLAFAEASELDAPSSVLHQAAACAELLQIVDAQLADAYLEEEDREWLVPRLGYAIGQYFILEYQCNWSVNTEMDSPQYGRYVVLVPSPKDAHIVYPIDPFEASYEYVYQEPDRDLLSLLDEIVGLIQSGL